MEIEKIIEMFPSKSEQRIAQRVIETLRACPDSNVEYISESISPNKSASARMADCNGLYHILDGLRALGAITCSSDNFSLNFGNKASVSLIYGSHKSNTRSSPVRSQARYVVFVCDNCGAGIGARSSQMSATCKTCNHKNKIDNERNVLLRTNNFLEVQNAIRLAKKPLSARINFFQELTLTQEAL